MLNFASTLYRVAPRMLKPESMGFYAVAEAPREGRYSGRWSPDWETHCRVVDALQRAYADADGYLWEAYYPAPFAIPDWESLRVLGAGIVETAPAESRTRSTPSSEASRTIDHPGDSITQHIALEGVPS